MIPLYNTNDYDTVLYNDNVIELDLFESLSLADVRTSQLVKQIMESMFLDTHDNEEITNKSLTEVIKTGDWLTINRNPSQNLWSD